MDITDTVVQDAPEADAEDRMGSIRSMFGKDVPKGVIVKEDGEYIGIIHQKKLMNSYIRDNTKAKTLVEPAPRIAREHGIREASRLMIEGGVKIAPYVSQTGKLEGVITHDSILQVVADKLSVLKVEDIYTSDVVYVSEDATLGQVVNKIREKGISRIPIVDEQEDLSGIVTTHDIVNVAVRTNESTTRGDRNGEPDRISEIPVTNIMSSPVATVEKEVQVDEAVHRMLDSSYGGLVVSPDGDEIEGVVTKTDAIRSLTYEEDDHLPVQVTNVNLMDGLDRKVVRSQLTEVVDKYQDMDVHYAHVRFHKERSESHRGEQLISCTIRLRTNKEQIAGSGEGYGSDKAFRIARDKLERNVLDLKGMNDPKRYREDILRDMSDY